MRFKNNTKCLWCKESFIHNTNDHDFNNNCEALHCECYSLLVLQDYDGNFLGFSAVVKVENQYYKLVNTINLSLLDKVIDNPMVSSLEFSDVRYSLLLQYNYIEVDYSTDLNKQAKDIVERLLKLQVFL